MLLNVHAIVRRSRANGPGLRTVIWVQGCSLCCPGCFNPDTHSTCPRHLMPVDELVQSLRADAPAVEGLTLSGGEPLDQPAAIAELLDDVRRQTALSVVLFTGYTWEEVQADALRTAAAGYADVLIAGRYNQTQRVAEGLLALANQTVHFLTGRYGPADLAAVPSSEVVIGPDGSIAVSGVDPVELPQPDGG